MSQSDERTSAAARTSRWQSYIAGPRWALGVDTIYDLAAAHGLTVESVQEHKSLLRKTVTFTITGSFERIAAAQRDGARAVEEWNRV